MEQFNFVVNTETGDSAFETSNKRNPDLARNKNLQPDNAKAWRESDVIAGSQHGHMPDWLR